MSTIVKRVKNIRVKGYTITFINRQKLLELLVFRYDYKDIAEILCLSLNSFLEQRQSICAITKLIELTRNVFCYS